MRPVHTGRPGKDIPHKGTCVRRLGQADNLDTAGHRHDDSGYRPNATGSFNNTGNQSDAVDNLDTAGNCT